MAKTVFEIDIETAGAVSSAKDLREQFSILEDKMFELANAGKEGTKEFEAIRRALAGTKERIDDLNETIDLLKPEAKFQAFANLGAGIASGFAAAQGAAQLFGSESEELNESLAKVQSAMALAQGVQGLAGMGDNLRVVGAMLKSTAIGTKLVTATQWLYNAAMAANPIGLVVAALAALVGVIALVVKSQESAIEEEKKLIAAREAELNQLKRLKDSLENFQSFETNLAKARGKTLIETRELEDKQYKERIENLRNLKNATQLQIDQIAAARLKADADESKELKTKQDELIKEEKSYNDEILQLIQNRSVIQEQRITDDLKAEEEKRKEADEKAKTARDKKTTDDLAAAEKWRQEQQKFIQYEIDALNNKFGEEEQIIAEQQLSTKIALGIATPDEIEAWNAFRLSEQKKYNDEVAAELKRLADEKAKLDKIDEEKAKKKEEDEKLRLENLKKAKEQEVQLTLQGLQAIQGLADSFAGKSVESQKRAFQIKKAASLAQATIETYQAAQSAYASQMTIPTPDAPIRANIAAAIAIASGLARVAVIAKQKFEGGGAGATGGGGGGNLGTFSQGSGGQPPQGLTAQNTVTQLNPDGSIAGQGNRQAAPMKAYVVESESRAVTERVNKLSNNSKIG